MKIIYLHQYFNTPAMAGGTRSYEMARRFVAAGHEVHMVTSIRESNCQQKGWFETQESGIKVHWFPVPYSNAMSYSQRIRAFFAFAKAARGKAIELEADVILATSTPLTIALPAVRAARKKAVPMVFEVRDLWPEVPIAVGALRNPLLCMAAQKLERWAYKHATAVIALSPGMKAGVVRTGYPAERVAVIPNSCDNRDFACSVDAGQQFRARREWLLDRPLLVYAGSFGKMNGVGYMVELASALLARKSNVRILLVGEGAERDSVEEAARRSGVYQKNLYIEDSISKRDMPALLSAATMASTLFIDLPEMRANSANKFFDALASGTPVLLNFGGWMHSLVKSHRCGLPVWQKPINEVAELVDAGMQDRLWLNQAGRAARDLAEQYFDRDVLADQMLTVLQLAVDGESQRSEAIAPGNYG